MTAGRVAERHHGKLEAGSTPRAGPTFTICLPAIWIAF